MRVTPQCDSINSFVICQTDSVEANPAVIFDGTNYIVVWEDFRFGVESRVVAARVTPQGAVLDTGNCIGNTGVAEQFPDIAFDGTRCLAVWLHYSTTSGISGRFVNTQALPEDTVITIATTEIYKYTNPKVAFGNNNYLVVWADIVPSTYNFNIYGQLISSQGELLGGKITIADESTSEIEPYIVFDNLQYLVAWNDSGTIWGRLIDTLGQPVGSSFLISENTGYTRSAPWIAVSDTNYLVVWSENHTDRDIYGNVDFIVGSSEESNKSVATGQSYQTIFAGPLILPADKKYTVYDITGRVVNPAHIKTGIYFIEIEGKVEVKVIKIR